jgi:hypothetical protein
MVKRVKFIVKNGIPYIRESYWLLGIIPIYIKYKFA